MWFLAMFCMADSDSESESESESESVPAEK